MPDTRSRKLAVILHADVIGSTILVRRNESIAHDRIHAAFVKFSKTIQSYGGTAHEIRGDALVAEFSRASDAVCAALVFQEENNGYNLNLDDDIRPEIRIGLSMGEVVIADNTITGAGVILAQRLEQLAEPNGVVVQGTVSETVPERLPFEFESLGDQQLKGFDQPVRAFTARQKPGTTLPAPELPVTISAHGETAEHKLDGMPSTADRTRPSIAVLAFENMSGDPGQEYFSDGITEDIITELSRFHELVVISRNSSFSYKGQFVNVGTIGKELGASYVVEGSVRKAGNRVRITAQLVEARTGNHLWAERYDRELEDIFAVQDEVVHAIIAAIPASINLTVYEQSRRKQPNSLTAYECLLQGNWLLDFSADQEQKALSAFEKAVEIDPTYALAWAKIAYVYFYMPFSKGVAVDDVASQARDAIERALEYDDNEARIHSMAAFTYLICGEYDRARLHSDRAVELNPNDAMYVIWDRGTALGWLGEHEEGFKWISEAIRLNPLKPGAIWESLSDNLYMQKNYQGAIESILRWDSPPFHIYAVLAVNYTQLGRMDDAAEARAKFEAARPVDYEIAGLIAANARMCKNQEDRDHWIEGFRKAGFKV